MTEHNCGKLDNTDRTVLIVFCHIFKSVIHVTDKMCCVGEERKLNRVNNKDDSSV